MTPSHLSPSEAALTRTFRSACLPTCPRKQDALKRAERLIQEGIDKGATLLLDGRGVKVAGSEKGNFIGPTILSNVTADNPAYTEEIFGPVLTIVSVDTLDDAIAFINANPYGNGTAIFTASGAAARKFQRDVDVGQVIGTRIIHSMDRRDMSRSRKRLACR